VIWQKYDTYRGHIGFVEKWNKSDGYTIEGNTSPDTKGNQRDGDSVYRKHRNITDIKSFRIVAFTPVS
jgi:hypothetical protein